MKIAKIINTSSGGQLYIKNGQRVYVIPFVLPVTAQQAFDRFCSTIKTDQTRQIASLPIDGVLPERAPGQPIMRRRRRKQ